MLRTLSLVTITILGLAACGKSGPASRCEKYGDMEARCGDVKGEGVSEMARSFCERAEKGDDVLNLAPEIACAQTTTDCDAYQACIKKAKGGD